MATNQEKTNTSLQLMQMFCTHCTCGTSAIERGTGARASHILGYSARASSFQDTKELKDVYGTIRHLLSYNLPVDTSSERKASHTASSAPKRYVYFPNISGRQIIGLVGYRPEDTTKRRSYFAHFLLADKANQLTLSDSLVLWGTDIWCQEDSADIPWQLEPLSLGVVKQTASDSILSDQTLRSFLFDASPALPSFLPARWQQLKPEQRAAWFRRILNDCLTHLGKKPIAIAVESEVACLLFFGLARFLPSTLANEISFSTYEDALDKIITSVAAIGYDSDQPKVELPKDATNKLVIVDTYNEKLELAPQNNRITYVDFALKTYSDSPRAWEQEKAVIEHRRLVKIADLDELAAWRSTQRAMLAQLWTGQSWSAAQWQLCTSTRYKEEFALSMRRELESVPSSELEGRTSLLASQMDKVVKLYELLKTKKPPVLIQSILALHGRFAEQIITDPDFQLDHKIKAIQLLPQQSNGGLITCLLELGDQLAPAICEIAPPGVSIEPLQSAVMQTTSDQRKKFLRMVYDAPEQYRGQCHRFLSELLKDKSKWQHELLSIVTFQRDTTIGRPLGDLLKTYLQQLLIKLPESRSIRTDLDIVLKSQGLKFVTEEIAPLLHNWVQIKNDIKECPRLANYKSSLIKLGDRRLCFRTYRLLKSSFAELQNSTTRYGSLWMAMADLASSYDCKFLAGTMRTNPPPGVSIPSNRQSTYERILYTLPSKWHWWSSLALVIVVILLVAAQTVFTVLSIRQQDFSAAQLGELETQHQEAERRVQQARKQRANQPKPKPKPSATNPLDPARMGPILPPGPNSNTTFPNPAQQPPAPQQPQQGQPQQGQPQQGQPQQGQPQQGQPQQGQPQQGQPQQGQPQQGQPQQGQPQQGTAPKSPALQGPAPTSPLEQPPSPPRREF